MALASFVPVKSSTLRVNRYPAATGITVAVGDPVELGSDGLVICATATSARLLGVAAEPITSAAAGSVINVFDDPKQVFRGKVDTAAENVATLVGEAHDIVGSTGAFYINSGATAINVVRVVANGHFVDGQLAASAADFYSQNDGTICYFEIALHALSS